ncbi:MAG: hypothetical protein WD404_04005 [Solirubrobacterales bacterium]
MRKPVLVALLFVSLLALIGTDTASAAKSHVFLEDFGSVEEPTFTRPAGMAVDQASGDLLVIDMTAQTLSRFHSDGTPSEFSALGTNVIDGAGGADETPQGEVLGNWGSAAEVQVAVDNSGAATDGNIYVTDSANGIVDIFSSAGEYIGQLGTFAAGFGETCGVAVDPTGNIYVGDYENGVHKFVPSANPPTNADKTATFGTISESCTLAAGAGASAGFLFVNQYEGSTRKIDASSGAVQYVVNSAPSLTVSVDPGSGDVYIANADANHFDASGSSPVLVETVAAGSFVVGLALRGSDTTLYLTREGNSKVAVYDLIFEPEVATGPASEVGETQATLAGSVDPEVSEGGSPVESCQFEYGTTTAYGQSAPCSPATPYSAATEVSAEIAGLSPSTTYHYRLVAENEEGNEGQGEDRTFSTRGAPAIDEERSIARTTSATVKAQIDPFGYETSCEVEYVDDASFAGSAYEGAASVACEEAIPSGFGAQPASAKLSGLSIGTVYHYRFVASNQAGTTIGEDQTFSTFGIEDYSVELLDAEGEPYTQAGGRPFEMKVSFELTATEPLTSRNPGSATANMRNVKVQLPPGLMGNPTAAEACPPHDVQPLLCPSGAQVGTAEAEMARGSAERAPVYNVVPPKGVAAQLSGRFNALGIVRINAGVRTGSDYGVNADTLSVTAVDAVTAVEVTVWGVPADEGHFSKRECTGTGIPPCKSDAAEVPFLTNPTACTGPLTARLSVDTWQEPGNYVSKDAAMPALEGCERLGFGPTIAVQPQVRTSDSPTGVRVNLHVPQNQDPLALATAHLKDATVRLPAGVAVNPSGANGLGACTPAQIELNGPHPASCPDAAKIGTVEVNTPLLDHVLKGAVYAAAPHDNPFNSLLAIYIAVHDPESGVVVKLAGHVKADPQTGQLTTTFSDNPQLPFEDFTLDFFGGPGAALVTPETCGAYATTTDLRPWSENGDKHPQSSFAIDSGPNGSACANTLAEKPNQQGFTAGTINPIAGDDSPFVLKLSREDGSQRLSRIDTVLPPGLVGRLAGVAYCPEAALAAAGAKQGVAEQASPSCPAASRIGTVNVGAGAGPRPYFTQGTAYLAGPYKGAPLSLAVITPAVAGPYDLGTVVVRVALHVDPETARITAKSDPLPQILEGIPLNLRSINLQADITRNPTSCAEMSVGGAAFSVLGQAASLSDRFQVGGCRGLGFKPRTNIRLFGKTNRGAYQGLRAVVRPRPGDANISRTVVRFPRSAFVAQENIRTICTRVQFAADACPKGSIYGKAIAYSPLVDYPLRGNVYLRSSDNALPDAVADLRGPAHQPIRIEVAVRNDSVKGALRNTVQTVPDAPVSYFRLQLFGKQKGLIVNSRNICRGKNQARVAMAAHNGRRSVEHVNVFNRKCKKLRRKAKRSTGHVSRASTVR